MTKKVADQVGVNLLACRMFVQRLAHINTRLDVHNEVGGFVKNPNLQWK